jgi:hypothetical protein
MKIAIVKSSEIAGCMLPLRFTGGCSECSRIMRCKLPEAKIGRGQLLIMRKAKLQATIEHIDKLIEENNEERDQGKA